MQELAGEIAVVSGGGSGIGLACAHALTAVGCHVVVLGRRPEPLQAAIAAGAAAEALVGDATCPPPLPPASILINAAGAASSAPFLRGTDEDFRHAYEANVITAVAMTRGLLPGMLARGHGRVVNVASTAALKGYAYVAPYAAAKHALLGFTRALALELATKGVTVNAVCPGFTATALLEESLTVTAAKSGRTIGALREEVAAMNPQKRLLTPEEVAATVLFLCTHAAAGINGAALPISGGEV